MPSLEEQIAANPLLLLRLSVKELDRQLNHNPSLLSHDFGNGDNILHIFIKKRGNFEAISYLIGRGHNLTTSEGIDCARLSPIDLSAQNNSGQNITQLTESLITQKNTNTLQEIKSIIQAAENNTLEEFFSKDNISERRLRRIELKHGSIASDNIALITSLMQAELNSTNPSFNSTETRSPTTKSLTWKAPTLLTREHEHIMPHYPSFNKKWNTKDPEYLGKRSFIEAYNNDDFIKMQEAIENYQIEFECNDTLSKLAYEAANQKHLYMANYLMKKGYVPRDYKPDGEFQSIQEKFDLAKNEGMHLFQEAVHLNDIEKMEEYILNYQLEFSEEETKRFAYIAAIKDRFKMLDHLLERNEEIKDAALSHTIKKGSPTLKEVLNKKVLSLMLKKNFKELENIITKYQLEPNESTAKLAANKAADKGFLKIAEYLIKTNQISAHSLLKGEIDSIGTKVTRKKTEIGRNKFQTAYRNQNFAAMEHILLKYNLSPPKGVSSVLAYKATDKGYLEMADYLIKNSGVSLSYRPNDRSSCLQEKLIQKNTELRMKKSTEQAKEIMNSTTFDNPPPSPNSKSNKEMKPILRRR